MSDNYLKETCLLLLETAFFRSAQTYSFRILYEQQNVVNFRHIVCIRKLKVKRDDIQHCVGVP